MKIFAVITTLLVLSSVLSNEKMNDCGYWKSLKKEFGFKYIFSLLFNTFFMLISYVVGVIYLFNPHIATSSESGAGGIMAYVMGLIMLSEWLKLILLRGRVSWYND